MDTAYRIERAVIVIVSPGAAPNTLTEAAEYNVESSDERSMAGGSVRYR
jgi:hypothetical protein